MLPLLIDPTHVDSFAYMIKEKRLPQRGTETQGDIWRIESGEVAEGDFACRVSIFGGTAVIPVVGPIDYKQSAWSRMGYMASSEAVRLDFNKLMNDPEVSRIVFDIDSPGGLYSGLPEVARDIFASRGSKQTIAVANPLAASGALWLGAATEKFFALGSGQVGSLGAIMLHQDYSRYLDANGITTTVLRKPEAKSDFNPYEPLSEESRQHHQQVINDIADEFTAAMAKFRGVSKSAAASQFGRGRVLSTTEAVSVGLIDGIVDSVASVVGPRVKTAKRVRLHPRLQLSRAK